MVREVRQGAVRAYDVQPADFGVERAQPETIRGGDPETNAAILLDVLQGRPGPTRDAAVINAGAALYAAGRADTFLDGARVAAEALDSRAAQTTLDRLRAVSQGARADVGSAA
jgi:anthranilate phosphoribosyltransferase